jgi:hypothetical protein
LLRISGKENCGRRKGRREERKTISKIFVGPIPLPKYRIFTYSPRSSSG